MSDIEQIREKFDAIRRSRLFYLTDDEFITKTGCDTLAHNSSKKLSPKHLKSLYYDFCEECKIVTNGEKNLDTLLEQFKASSNFYDKNIQGKKLLSKQENRWYFLYLILGGDKDEDTNKKIISLYDKYTAKNKEGLLDPGIILLLTLGLIPTFNNKKSQDPINIENDYKAIINEIWDFYEYIQKYLPNILHNNKLKDCKDYLNNTNKVMCRLALFLYTSSFLSNIPISPHKRLTDQRDLQSLPPLDFIKNKFWRVKGQNNDFMILIHMQDTTYNQLRRIHYIRIPLPSSIENNIVKISEDVITIIDKEYNYMITPLNPNYMTNIIKSSIDRRPSDLDIIKIFGTLSVDLDTKGNAINIIFSEEKGELTLERADDEYKYYETFLESDLENFNSVLNSIEPIEPFIQRNCIIFPLKDGSYRLDKSNEALKDIPIVSELTHKDSFWVIEDETENGDKKHYILLPSEEYLCIEELLKKSYFKKTDNRIES